MTKFVLAGFMLLLLGSMAFAITAVEGTVTKIDRTAKTIVVRAADGTEHTFNFAARTVVHGGQRGAVVARDAFHGLKEGSNVVVHYTATGTKDTAEEIDHVGKEGLKTTEGTVTHIDRDAKTLAVKTADGSEQSFRLTRRAADDAGKDVAQGTEKSGKVTVYYTEEAGRKVAHFFKRAL